MFKVYYTEFLEGRWFKGISYVYGVRSEDEHGNKTTQFLIYVPELSEEKWKWVSSSCCVPAKQDADLFCVTPEPLYEEISEKELDIYVDIIPSMYVEKYKTFEDMK